MKKVLKEVSIAVAVYSISAASIAFAQQTPGQTGKTQAPKGRAAAIGKGALAPNNGVLLNSIKQNGLPGDGSLFRQIQQRMRAQGVEPGSGAILRQIRAQGEVGGKTGAMGSKAAILNQLKKQGNLPMDGSLLKQALKNNASIGKHATVREK